MQQKDLSLMSDALFCLIVKCKIDDKDLHLIKQSYHAYCAAEGEMYDQNHMARAIKCLNLILITLKHTLVFLNP